MGKESPAVRRRRSRARAIAVTAVLELGALARWATGCVSDTSQPLNGGANDASQGSDAGPQPLDAGDATAKLVDGATDSGSDASSASDTGGTEDDAKGLDDATNDGGVTALDAQVDCGVEASVCSAECVDLSTDVNNCGTCGNVCQAGPGPGCSAGHCNYTLFNPNGSGASGSSIATDGVNAYWLEELNDGQGWVYSCPVSGCGNAPTTLWTGVGFLTGGVTGPVYIVTDGASVYWITSLGVYSCAVGGCPDAGPNSVVYNPSGGIGGALAKQGGVVYFSSLSEIQDCPATDNCGSTPSQFTTIANSGNGTAAMTTDAANVYWTDGSNVYACPLGGCTSATTIASNQPQVTSIASDGANLYWTDYDGSVMKCATTGCGQQPAVFYAGVALSVTTDGTNVYWIDTEAGTVEQELLRCPSSGCPGTGPEILYRANGQGEGISSPVLDGHNVYWTDYFDGTTRYTAK